MPTPDVDEEDVRRVLRRDYSHADLDELWEVIAQVEVVEKWRVMMACLKVGGGSVEKLRGELANASGWWREIISEAEYPEATKKTFRIDKFSPEEQRAIFDRDWKQYEAWLKRE
jgi:hypothetical protein